MSVLPLSILPFVPEQSITHYGAHVVYTLGQVPLVVLALPRRCGHLQPPMIGPSAPARVP